MHDTMMEWCPKFVNRGGHEGPRKPGLPGFPSRDFVPLALKSDTTENDNLRTLMTTLEARHLYMNVICRLALTLVFAVSLVFSAGVTALAQKSILGFTP